MEKDKILYSPHRQYQINITKLIEISQLIDKDNKYSQEINNKFFKDLFRDLRSGSKWYEESQWKPIKAAIHNCYKLVQKGFVADNQRELENNIIILEKLIKEPNPKRIRLEKLSEQVVQNIFDNTLNLLKKKAQEQDNIKKSFDNMPVNIKNEFENFEKSKDIPNEIVEKVINTESNNTTLSGNTGNKCKCNEYYEKKLMEQREFYENKINTVNNRLIQVENEMKEMKDMFLKLKKVFNDYK